MSNTSDEPKELALFARYMDNTQPFVEQLAADFQVLTANPDIVHDERAIQQLWVKALTRLTAIAEIDPPQSVLLAHVRLTQTCAHMTSAFQAAMNKEFPKSIGHIMFAQQTMAETPSLIEPMNQKFKKAMSPLMKHFK